MRTPAAAGFGRGRACAGCCDKIGPMTTPRITAELAVLEALVPLQGTGTGEAGCGAAHLARTLLSRCKSLHR